MNIKQAVRGRLRGHVGETDLNLTAVMNIFLILIPFLLLTATFVRIAILDLTLPSLDQTRERTVTPTSSVVINILLIKETGLELNSPGLSFPALAKEGRDYAWNTLEQQLARVKTRHPKSQDIIISPDDNIRYEIIISVMDRCREAGFPNISISG